MYNISVIFERIIIQFIMFGFLWRKKDKQFNLVKNYLLIEFLTDQEKVQKDIAIERLNKEFQNNIDTIVPYTSSFQCSFRYTLNSNNIKDKILLAELMALVQASSDPEMAAFYETNVNKIKLHLQNDRAVKPEDVLELYNERDISVYSPSEVLEIIYQKKGFLQRLKQKTKKFVKNIPKYAMNLISKVIGAVLKYIGFGSVSNILSTFLPIKFILRWILNILMVFFPPLAPIIGLVKLF